jgi:hypothetical protein
MRPARSVRTFALACGLLASPKAQSSGGQNFVVVLPERCLDPMGSRTGPPERLVQPAAGFPKEA